MLLSFKEKQNEYKTNLAQKLPHEHSSLKGEIQKTRRMMSLGRCTEEMR